MSLITSRLKIYPDELAILKSDLVNNFEFLWRRMKFTKDFEIRGHIACTDKKHEITFIFNEIGRGSEKNSDLNMTEYQAFLHLKNGSARRVALPPTEIKLIEILLRQKLERFLGSKYPHFDFKASGVLVLFDGSVEVHMRMRNIRNMMFDDEVIEVIDDEEEGGQEEEEDKSAKPSTGGSRSPVISVSSDEESTPSAKADENLEGVNQNEKLRFYLTKYLKSAPIQKTVTDKLSSEEIKIKDEDTSQTPSEDSLHFSGDDQVRTRKRKSSFNYIEVKPSRQKLCADFPKDDQRVYECKICSDSVTGQYNYLQHSKSLHGRIPCYICGDTFTQKGNMERHMGSHSGKKKFKCIQCDAAYTRFESLQNHWSRSHE